MYRNRGKMGQELKDKKSYLATIAGRTYPLLIAAEDHSKVTVICDKVNKAINRVQNRHRDLEQLDHVIMAFLTYALQNSDHTEKEEISEKISDLEQSLDALLS